MFLELHKSYSSWIEKKKFLCTRGHAFSPLLLPKPLFILSYHNTVQPSAQCNDHCEKTFVELSTLQNFLHFYCTNLRPNLSAQLWWPEFAQTQSWHLLRRYYNLLVSGSIGHESSPQASYINIPAVPKRPRNYPKNEDALNCPGQDPRVRALPTCAIVMTPCLLL